MKKRTHRSRSFPQMNTHELAEATAAYGREMAIDEFGPMNPEARERWNHARLRPGRPTRGRGSRAISVSVEQELLDRADRLSRELGISRARLIEHGLRVVLANHGEFIKVAERLVASRKSTTRKRRKKELATLTYGE